MYKIPRNIHAVHAFDACYVYDNKIFSKIAIASLYKCYIVKIFIVKNTVLTVCAVHNVNDQVYISVQQVAET